MKVTVPASSLSRAGRRVLQMRRTTDTVPWSRMALLETRDTGGLRLSTVNADGGAREVVKTGVVTAPGAVAVDVEMLDRLLTVLPQSGDVVIGLDGTTLTASCGRVRQRVPVADAGLFAWPPDKPGSWFPLPESALSRVSQSVTWAVSDDPGMTRFCAVHMTDAVSEATNGHVAAQVRPGLLPTGCRVLVPAEAWARIKAFNCGDRMSASVDGGRLWIRGENWILFQRLLPSADYFDMSHFAFAPDGDGIHFWKTEPVRVYSVLVSREEVLTTCRHIFSGAVTRDERSMGSGVRILVDDTGAMRMTSHYPADVACRGIDVDETVRWSPDLVTGDDLSPFSHLSGYCFYSLYMVKALSAMSCDIVKMMWNGEEGKVLPLQFHGGDGVVTFVSPRHL